MKIGTRISFLVLVLSVITTIAGAQDLIVTNMGDSLNCRITYIKYERIYFVVPKDNLEISSFIPVKDVSYYATGFYTNSHGYSGKSVPKYEMPSIFDISVNGAYSYRTAPIDPSANLLEKDYYGGLKKGFNYGADLIFYFNDVYGGGLKYSASRYSNKLDGVTITYPGGITKYGEISDIITVSFIGPAFYSRKYSQKLNGSWIIGISLGYMRYNDNCKVIDPMKITGETLGVGIDMAYELQVSSGVSLGARLSYIAGNLSQVKIDDGTSIEVLKLPSGQYESLSRIDGGIVLKFKLL
ncbi:MAG TPA: hypothetical protein VK172_11320 [Lentimicrobium sp.]|nr:hypothetical protein [Lentimicrobium sp.]